MSSAQSLEPALGDLTISQIFELLENERKAPRRSATQRSHARPIWVTHVTVSILSNNRCVSYMDDTLTYDLSSAGISFHWRKPVIPNTTVVVWFESLRQRPKLVAEVRHCTHLGGVFYHVGAEFIDDEFAVP